MKIIYVFLLIIITVELRGQKQTEKFKGANTITVVKDFSEDSLFVFCGKTLLDNNYTIIDNNSQFKTFRVKKSIPGYGIDVFLDIRIKDSTVILKGYSTSSNYRFELYYRKEKNLYGVSFAEVDRLAQSIGGSVYYEKVKY